MNFYVLIIIKRVLKSPSYDGIACVYCPPLFFSDFNFTIITCVILWHNINQILQMEIISYLVLCNLLQNC